MKPAQALTFLLAALAALASRAETPSEPAAGDAREIAKREAWTSVVLITSLLEQGDNSDFPGIRAWLEDFRQTAATTPPPEEGKAFPPIDSHALVTRNPHYWMAFYEIQPGDPGLTLLHAALLLSAGEAQRASAVASFGLQRPGIPAEIKRGLVSVIAHCQTAQARSTAFVREGMRAHDRRDYDAALGFYDRALAEWPANGAAHAERGLTYRARAVSEARERAQAEGPDAIFAPGDPPETDAAFAIARRHDPFNLLAYQGDDAETLTGLMALVRMGLPAWDHIRKHPEQPVKLEQLRAFSEACRDAAIDDFALILRQLVVAARKRYHPDDQELISECLRRLAPAALTSGVLARIGGETRPPTRQIVVPAAVEPPEVALSATEDEKEKPKAEAKPAPKPKSKTTSSSSKKKKPTASSSKSKSKSKSGTASKSGSSSSKGKTTTSKSGSSKPKSTAGSSSKGKSKKSR